MIYDENLARVTRGPEDPAKDEAHELWMEDGLLCVNTRVFAEICFRVGAKGVLRALREYRDPIITFAPYLPEE